MAKKEDLTKKEKKVFQRQSKSPNLSMGIVGLPNVGKSTLFNRLTESAVPAENYPFCTIKPSIGHVKIDDPRINFLASIYKPKRVVHAYLTITDIAGIVKGANEGEGLGNEFLDNIRNEDGIFLVVRCFEDNSVIHVENSIDPIRDIKTVRDELRIKDHDNMVDALSKMEKLYNAKKNEKKIVDAYNTHKRLIEILKTKWVTEEMYDNDELEYINTLNLLTTKNVVILANVTGADLKATKITNPHLQRVVDAYGDDVIPFSATDGIVDPAVFAPFSDTFITTLVKKGYESLNLINFFTVGKDEVKSWAICKNDKAPRAGSAIHTDFEKYFMSVDVMNYNEFVKHPSEAQMKAVGKYMQKGKDYVVNDGDILYFKSNPPKTANKK